MRSGRTTSAGSTRTAPSTTWAIARTAGIDVIDTRTLHVQADPRQRPVRRRQAQRRRHRGEQRYLRTRRRRDARPVALCRRRRQHAQGVRPRWAQRARPKQPLSTGGTTRVDEMALTSGRRNAAHGEQRRGPALRESVRGERRPAITARFVSSRKITIDAGGCPGHPGDRAADLGSDDQAVLCVGADRRWQSGGLFFTCELARNSCDCRHLRRRAAGDRSEHVTHGQHEARRLRSGRRTPGVIKLSNCGPNGATVGPHDNLMLGCTSANNPSNTARW